MSWLTVFARHAGLGGLLDAIEGAEKNPSPATIAGAVGSIVSAAPSAANLAINEVGALAGQVVVGAATRLNPALGTVTAAVVGPLLSELEAVAEKWLAGATGGVA
jgi:hypothetical protein